MSDEITQGSPVASAAEPSSASLTTRVLKTKADRAAWQAYMTLSPSATAYHDLAWSGIFERGMGYRALPLAAFDARNRCCGVLPLFQVPSFATGCRLVAVPFRDRGGVLADHPAAFLSLIAAARSLGRSLNASRVIVKSLNPYSREEVESSGLVPREYWVHSETDLSGLTWVEFQRRIGPKTRNMVRQAERAGLVVEDAPITEETLAAWQHLHERSQRHLGLPAFPRVFFEAMLAELAPKGTIRLCLVRAGDGRAVAGAILLMERTRAIYAYSASLSAYRDVRPNDLMLYRIFEQLLANGVARFDFGSDAPSQTGLLFFKRKWLATQRVLTTYGLGEAPLMPDSSAPIYRAARAVLRRVPGRISRAIFTPLIRYLG